jgi:hypothetical protein
MNRLFSWTAVGLLIAGPFGTCRSWGHSGNPTALPPGGANTPEQTGTSTALQPGGANSPGSAGTAGTAQPAGHAGTSAPAGTAFPAGRAGTSIPATRLSPRSFDPSINTAPSRLLNDPSIARRGFDPSTGRTYFSDGTSTRQRVGENAATVGAVPGTSEQRGTATATAFPIDARAANRGIAVTASPSQRKPRAPNIAEIEAGRVMQMTTHRPRATTVERRSEATITDAGYTIWQGYYWHRSPITGWHYWDGQRWVQFNNVRTTGS